jgi:hypothetical protein
MCLRWCLVVGRNLLVLNQPPTKAAVPPTPVGAGRGRAEVLVRYGESGLRVVTKPITGLVANVTDR